MHSYSKFLKLLICLPVVLSFALAGCGGSSVEDELLGVWTDETGVLEIEFEPDGVVMVRAMGDEQEGSYNAEDGKITATDPDTGEVNEVDYTIEGDKLLLGADGEEGTLVRKTDADDSAATATEQETAQVEEAGNMSGSELGDAVGATWAEAMQELVALLADKPEPETVAPQVEQLKEEYVQQLVDLGHQGAALDSAEKAQMTSRTGLAIAEGGSEEWYTTYADLYDYYAGSDMELGNLIADFNILTQYGDFELLKQQAPEEAARLGIE